MSRVAKNPIQVPAGVDVNISGQVIAVKGSKGSLKRELHPAVMVKKENNVLTISLLPEQQMHDAQAGTARALISNMVQGVSQGFERKLVLVGVGYRAQAQGKVLNLSLGFSHPIKHIMPEGVTVETPSQTEITIKGIDKQLVGQVAAEIRAYRPPEPYKGKGVRYANEVIVLKEGKKK
jgi:large subunit ribosomal protein L6